jgi:hypothetical protein
LSKICVYKKSASAIRPCLAKLWSQSPCSARARASAVARQRDDVHTETKMQGTVEEVKLPPKGSEKEVVHLLVKNATETVDARIEVRESILRSTFAPSPEEWA